MKLPSVGYVRPNSVEEAVDALSVENARVIAGGQSLVPMMAMRLSYPSSLVDVRRIRDLQRVSWINRRLEIGAAVTQTQLLAYTDRTDSCAEMLQSVIVNIGPHAVRNCGTVGGSLCHADPSAEWPALALALDAMVEVAGLDGSRRISAKDLFVNVFETTIKPGEILTRVIIPVDRIDSWGFSEVVRRKGDFALAGCVVSANVEGSKVFNTRIVLFGCYSTPVRLVRLEERIDGETSAGVIEGVTDFQFDTVPLDDVQINGDARAYLAKGVIRRALEDMLRRADVLRG